MKHQKVIIATPLYESKGWGNYIRSLVRATRLLEQVKQAKGEKCFDFDVWHPEGNSYVDDARNMIAHHFLKTDATHLWFWDSDVAVDMPGFARVLKAPGEIVGAAFRVKNAQKRWSTVLARDKDGMLMRDPITGLFKALRIATGFMKISRTVFEKIREQSPNNHYYNPTTDELIYGFFNFMQVGQYMLREDYGFCERAKDAGVEIWCETRVRTGHFGVHEWSGCLHDLFDSDEDHPKDYSY